MLSQLSSSIRELCKLFLAHGSLFNTVSVILVRQAIGNCCTVVEAAILSSILSSILSL